ncbi:MAG: septum site-determining protein MinC [Gammaproteobacteria bacterium]|nr:MAG: septum site-determining protein MinC [Gammaproteobacteria bacterium]
MTTLTFKNNLSGLTVLQLHSQQLEPLRQGLRETIKKAPMMFIGMQVVADISAFDKDDSLVLDIGSFSKLLTAEGLNLVAVMTNRQSFRVMAISQGVGAIPVTRLPSSKGTTAREAKSSETPVDSNSVAGQSDIASFEIGKRSRQLTRPQKADDSKRLTREEPRKTFERSESHDILRGNKIIQQPIRSGQRVYTQGDLTIIGSVSPGAEVIADGSVHVYGKLRGRAVAGAKGDTSAQIFCRQLDAELISIAGNYKPNEEISDVYRQKSVQIRLENEKISFLPL